MALISDSNMNKNEAPVEVLLFYDIRDTIKVEDELILKGEIVHI